MLYILNLEMIQIQLQKMLYILNLEIIQIQKVTWSMKESSVLGSSIEHMSGCRVIKHLIIVKLLLQIADFVLTMISNKAYMN